MGGGWSAALEDHLENASREKKMAYLEITLHIDKANRPAAAGVYTQYRDPFLETVPGAVSKQLLIRDEDVQVLHQFDSVGEANAYLASDLFTRDIVGALSPLVSQGPEVRVYDTP
jgi:hypothetical protein